MDNSIKQTQISKLEHFPIAFFAMVMGLTGLTLAWEKAAVILGLPTIIGESLLYLSATAFLLVTLTYLLKAIRHRSAVLKEFNHPIKISFFPAFSISLILMSIATLGVSKTLSEYLWVLGVSLHLIFTLYVLGQWLHHPKFKIAHSTPAWFIPVVGNILVPIAGVQHGYNEISWFFFSIGLIYWIILKTLILNRMFFHDPLPEKLLPTLFILIAPPAVGFISYTQLTGGVDSFSRILFYSAMFLVLFLLSQLPRFSRIQFFMSWWAYSFPLAASTVASFVMQQHNPSFSPIFSIALLCLSSGVITLLLFRTLLGITRGEICRPE